MKDGKNWKLRTDFGIVLVITIIASVTIILVGIGFHHFSLAIFGSGILFTVIPFSVVIARILGKHRL